MGKPDRLGARRERRARTRVRAKAGGRPRLCVFRSLRYVYAQVIDDQQGQTLATASSLEKDLREEHGSRVTVVSAAAVGARLAERARTAGVSDVVFDRGRYRYHGRVRALADAAREGGLVF